jgi:hypothetical protein
MFIHATLDSVPLLLSGPHKFAKYGLDFLGLNGRNGPVKGETFVLCELFSTPPKDHCTILFWKRRKWRGIRGLHGFN